MRVAQLSVTFGMTETTIYNWLKQDSVDRGEDGRAEHEEALDLAAAKRRIKHLETELAVSRKVIEVFLEGGPPPKRLFPVIESLAGQGINVAHACRMLGVSESGYYGGRTGPTAPRTLRRSGWPARSPTSTRPPPAPMAAARDCRAAPRPRHRRRSQHGRGDHARDRAQGAADAASAQGARLAQVTSLDLVRREFGRDSPNQLWMTDITEHPTREGKIYCCVVLDPFSRLVVGWSVESTQTTVLVPNALGMATQPSQARRRPRHHFDRGVQFTSWAFSRQSPRRRPRSIDGSDRLHPTTAPSSRAFWGRMQVELFNRLAAGRPGSSSRAPSSTIAQIEHFHNSRLRHAALGMLTPAEAEAQHAYAE